MSGLAGCPALLCSALMVCVLLGVPCIDVRYWEKPRGYCPGWSNLIYFCLIFPLSGGKKKKKDGEVRRMRTDLLWWEYSPRSPINLWLYKILLAPPLPMPVNEIQMGGWRPSGLKLKAALKLWPLICTSSKKRETYLNVQNVHRGTASAHMYLWSVTRSNFQSHAGVKQELVGWGTCTAL